MATPVFRNTGGSRPSPWPSAVTGSGDVTTFTIQLADHAQGDRVYIGVVFDGTATINSDPPDFTSKGGALAASNQATILIYESTSLAPSGGFADQNITISVAQKFACFSWAMSGDTAMETALGGSGTSAAPNPNAITPAAGVNDWLYGVLLGFDTSVTVSSYSSGYSYATGAAQSDNTSGGGCSVGVCFKATTSSTTDDPGAWSVSISEQWGGITFAIRPNAGGTTISPGKGSLTFTGYVPSIDQPQSIAPANGALTFTGYAPTISQLQAIAPAKGALAFTGYTPSITQGAGQVINPSKGSLVFAGYAPAISQGAARILTPLSGHFSFTGYIPMITQGGTITVPPLNMASVAAQDFVAVARANASSPSIAANSNTIPVVYRPRGGTSWP